MIRKLAMLFALSFVAGPCWAEKVVLKNGQTFDVQAKPVVMDGYWVFRDSYNKTHSLPLSQINLQATELANAGRVTPLRVASPVAEPVTSSSPGVARTMLSEPKELARAPISVTELDSPKPAPRNQNPGQQPAVFARGHKVYVVGVQSRLRDLSLTSADLGIERKAKEQFRKEKRFQLPRTVSEADFVFFLMLDPDSIYTDELALVVLPSDYTQHGHSLDALRMKALWQDSHHENVGKEAAIAGATLGVSALFRNTPISKQLVKRFHRSLS